MRFTRAVMVFVALFYVFLWVLDLNGMTSLTPVLVVPAVLAVLVAFGVWLNNFMGITPRSPKFVEPDAVTSPATQPTTQPPTERATATEVDAASPQGGARDAVTPSLTTDPAISSQAPASAPEAPPKAPSGVTPRDRGSSEAPARPPADPHGGPPA